MSDQHGRRFSDSIVVVALKTLPILLLLGTFLIGWGRLNERVENHDRLLQEIRQDIKEILKEVRPQ